MDVLTLYGQFSLLTVAASLLAILALLITTGSTSQQVKRIREFRMSVQRASRTCMRARSTALTGEFDDQDDSVLLSSSERPRRFYVRNLIASSGRSLPSPGTATTYVSGVCGGTSRRSSASKRKVGVSFGHWKLAGNSPANKVPRARHDLSIKLPQLASRVQM
jgi:hypothetical protein